MVRRFALILAVAAQFGRAETPIKPTGVVTIDLSRAKAESLESLRNIGGANPQGLVIAATSRYLTFAGHPWFPAVAEFASARYPENEWEGELLKIKAARVSIIEVPVIWIYHEEKRGQFNWSGDRDIAAFVRLCAKEGMPCIIRVVLGGEAGVRHGGTPDWFVRAPAGTYDMNVVAHSAFFASLGLELKGLLWKEGGPVIGVQFSLAPGAHPDQHRRLKETANESGIDVPLYFAAIDAGAPETIRNEFLPLQLIQPDEAGSTSLSDPLPTGDKAYLFDLGSKPQPGFVSVLSTGIASTYRRRPALGADDVAAEALTALGSGSNLLIYRSFHGGIVPNSSGDGLNETRASGSSADLPFYNADAQSPISAYGDIRPSYRALRELNLFMNDFGALLAPLPTWAPDTVPSGASDTKTVRWSVRSNGDSGFLFINNHRRTEQLPLRKDVQFELKYADHVQQVPVAPITIPAQTYAIWPLNLWMGGVKLIYSTAQPLCRIGSWYIFFGHPGILVDFLFDKSTLIPGAAAHLGPITPGLDSTFTVTSSNGTEVHVLILNSTQAALVSKFKLDGKDRLVLGETIVQAGSALRVTLSAGQATPVLVFPKVTFNQPSGTEGIFSSYMLGAGPAPQRIAEEDTNPLHEYQVAVDSAGLPIPPSASDYDNGQLIRVRIPLQYLNPSANPVLKFVYAGDAAEAFVGGRLIADAFYDGSEWKIPINRFLPEIIDKGLSLKIVPFNLGAPIYVSPANAPWFGGEQKNWPVRIHVFAEETRTVDLTPTGLAK